MQPTIDFENGVRCVVGTIEFIGNSLRTGEPLGECRVEVRKGEFPHPIFYVVNDNGFKCALSVDKPRFCKDESAPDILDEVQIIQLYKFMKDKCKLKTLKKFDTWKAVKISYEMFNGSQGLEKKADTTDYRKIYKYKKPESETSKEKA